ncbi:hypothetical protein GOP47_0008909 [Adiantum capillus-veneris]|uniref:Pentatricopeptide repeat-containing protein n=1 Tax=Adiantum capillus-veneris TaxID=13818 RepID=A0A9D4UZI0_ADICA|nr:hypothetical protein GOP47_0008909 [Adiantum capillus-veneris]
MSRTSLRPPKVSQRLLHEPALVTRLKLCAHQQDLLRGSILHSLIHEKGLLKNPFIGSSLVNLYAKCGALTKAKEVFDELPLQDVVTWTALIAGYAHHGHGQQALDLFEAMHHDGISPNAATFVCILTACGNMRAIEKGHEIHAEIVQKGLLDNNEILSTAVVDMYAKCGALGSAQLVFDEIFCRGTVLWTALITGYTQYGDCEKSVDFFKQMQLEGSFPNAITFACMLQAYGALGAGKQGMEIHSVVLKEGLLESDAVLGSALLEFYVKCGVLRKAHEVFDELPARDVVSWTGLITGYCHHGHGAEALHCFEQMKSEGVLPNAMTFACALKACGSIGAFEKGKLVHSEMVRQGLLGYDTVLGNALVDMYAKCGALNKAQEVFEDLEAQNVASWNALLSGYCQHAHGSEALHCFQQMQTTGLSPDSVTLLCVLQACASAGAVDKGKEIHARIVREDLLSANRLMGNALVDMYAKCGLLANAHKVFDELLVWDTVSWNAIIAGYCQHGYNEEALNCFERMQNEGLFPDAPTFARVLKVCGSIGAAEKGREIQLEIVRKGLLLKDLVLGTALVDMHAKCGELAEAKEVFDALPFKDVVAWTALISGYCQHGYFEESLNCYKLMQCIGISIDAMTLACILKACGKLGLAEKGKEVFMAFTKDGLWGEDFVLASALLDMYAKCGLIEKAQEVFTQLLKRDVVSWTTLISGYAQLGKQNLIHYCFDEMIEDGVVPNSITYMVMLNACSYLGLVSEGEHYFESMCTVYNIIPSTEHDNCMVSLFAESALFDKTKKMMTKEPLLNHLPAWLSLLGACQKWENTKLGDLAFSNAVKLNKKDALAFVRLCNLYASADMHRYTSLLIKDETEIQDNYWIDNCKSNGVIFHENKGLLETNVVSQ